MSRSRLLRWLDPVVKVRGAEAQAAAAELPEQRRDLRLGRAFVIVAFVAVGVDSFLVFGDRDRGAMFDVWVFESPGGFEIRTRSQMAPYLPEPGEGLDDAKPFPDNFRALVRTYYSWTPVSSAPLVPPLWREWEVGVGDAKDRAELRRLSPDLFARILEHAPDDDRWGADARRAARDPALGQRGYASGTSLYPRGLASAVMRLAALVLLPLGFVRLIRQERRVSRAERGLCPRCGYDRSADDGACPECGFEPAPASA